MVDLLVVTNSKAKTSSNRCLYIVSYYPGTVLIRRTIRKHKFSYSRIIRFATQKGHKICMEKISVHGTMAVQE